jgi:hypothetical protein
MIEARHSAKTYVKENIKRIGTSWHLPMPELAAYPGAVPLMIGKDPMKPAFRAPLYLQELLYEFNLEVARRQKEEPALTADAGAEPGAMTGLKDRVKGPAGHLTAHPGAILCTMLSEHVPVTVPTTYPATLPERGAGRSPGCRRPPTCGWAWLYQQL